MKRIISVLIALYLMVFLAAGVMAANDYGLLYDESELLDADAMNLLSNTMQSMASESNVLITAQLVTDTNGMTVEEVCARQLENFGAENAILLTIHAENQRDDLVFVDYSWQARGNWADVEAVSVALDPLDNWLNADAWNGDLNADRAECVEALNYYVGAVGSLTGVAAESQGTYVFDEANLLSADEREKLEALSAEITAEYPINIYVATVDDFRNIDSSSIYNAAKQYYLSRGLGFGDGRDGMLLMLSMDDRDYTLIAYGDYATTNLTDYGRQKLSEEFLDDFRHDDWCGGFEDYFKVTKEYLHEAKVNRPVDNYPEEPPDPKKVRSLGAVISLLMGYPASALVCGGMKSKLRSVQAASSANQYLNAGSVNFSDRSEVFTHTTQVRTPIPRQTREDSGGGSSFGGGGSHIDSSGFAGHSGKF